MTAHVGMTESGETLRQVAGTGTGSTLVLVCDMGLIADGVLSLLSGRFRTLEDT